MHNSTSRPSPTSPVASSIARYRWAIAWRSLVAILGGYLLAPAIRHWQSGVGVSQSAWRLRGAATDLQAAVGAALLVVLAWLL